MRNLLFCSVMLSVLVVGCGTESAGTDVIIVFPDNGGSDTAVSSDITVTGDNGQIERDTTVSDSNVAGDAGDVTTADQIVSNDTAADANSADNGSDVEDISAPQCWLGQDECQPQDLYNKMTCKTAQIIGRVAFLGDNTYSRMNPETINEKIGPNENDDELDDDGCPWFPDDGDPLWCQSKCDDDGRDHFYRIYLMAGDSFSFTINDRLVLEHEDYGYHIDFMLKVYKGYSCPPDRDDLMTCVNEKDGIGVTYNMIEIKPMTEEEEGWYTIVVDSTDDEEAGTYSVSASLFQNQEYTGDWSICCDFPLLLI